MEPGELIDDHYRLVSLVGTGGMGEVYRAVDERLRRDVAIKVLPHSGSSADRDARLLREAQAASHLNHPGIVTIHDVGRWQDRTYIVMELVDGRRLSELAGSGIPPVQAVSLCRQAAEAMAVAHERGILHRDIKPDNLMVTRDARVKILDFGVAKVYDPNASVDTPLPGPIPLPPLPEPPPGEALDDTLLGPPHTPATISVTRTGALLGTPAYMSPEQAAGAPVDERSEVYSLGLVLYELLTGIRPLQRATLVDTLTVAREPRVPPPSQAAPARNIPRVCDGLIERALARAPADRHPSMRALATDLRVLEQSLVHRPRRRWPFVAFAATGVAVAGAFALWPASDEPPDRASAAPIEVTGVRRLTFDPGCEELPAFWPDGESIVFDGIVDGDTELVRLDLATGARQRLTRRPGWDIGASVSPDGRSVAFIAFTDRGREVMVLPWSERGAGEPRSYGVFGGYPSWTADGRLLFGDDLSALVRVDLAGKGEREVFASAPGFVAIKAQEMADGEVLVALRHAGQNPARMQLGRTRGGRVTLFGTTAANEQTVITRDASGHGYYVGESSETGPRLIWRALDGGEEHELASLPFAHGGVTAARSGRRLVLSTCGQVFRVGRIEGGRFSPLFTGRDWNDMNVVAAADGSYVFASDRSGPNEIWGGRPGEEPHRIIGEPSNSPAVSGSQLAWVGAAPGRFGIHLSRLADGSWLRQLTHDSTDDRPAFSRDGAFLYFMRGAADGARVYRVPVAGGDPVAVSDGGVLAFDLSPDDGSVALLVQDERGRHLVRGAPGGPFARVAGLPDANYSELAFSQDGKTLYVARGASEILELPADGHAEPHVVWQTTNDLVSFISADAHGLLADVATYEGDIYLVEGRFR